MDFGRLDDGHFQLGSSPPQPGGYGDASRATSEDEHMTVFRAGHGEG
jgi:hypothetical protein